MNKIDKLTPEQEKKLDEYYKKYLEIGYSTEPCDRAKAEQTFKDIYAYLNLKAPTSFIWVPSPFVGTKVAAALSAGKVTDLLKQYAPERCGNAPTEELTIDEIKRQGDSASYGSFDSYWVAFYTYIARELPVPSDQLIDYINELCRHAGVYWTFENVVVISEKPVEIHLDEEKRIHSLTQKAVLYKDGTGLFAVHGEVKKTLMDVILNKTLEKETA